MINGVSEYTSTVTGEKYKIDGYYTYKTHNCVYLVTCGICNMQYVGKTTKSMRERHEQHRKDIKVNRFGLGTNFFKHAEEMGINMNIILERKHNQKQFQCKLCEFRSNRPKHIWQHKRREHSDYKVLCDRCGYLTNIKSDFNSNVRRMHPEYVL